MLKQFGGRLTPAAHEIPARLETERALQKQKIVHPAATQVL